jgi:hypothetical protein
MKLTKSQQAIVDWLQAHGGEWRPWYEVPGLNNAKDAQVLFKRTIELLPDGSVKFKSEDADDSTNG